MSINSQNTFNNSNPDGIVIPSQVTHADIPKLVINISKLINFKLAEANNDIKKYYPPISDFTNESSATKTIRPKLTPPIDPSKLPTENLPYNPIYNLLNGDSKTNNKGLKKTVNDYLANLIETIKIYNGDTAKSIPSPTCIPYNTALDIIKNNDDTTYCSSYKSSNTSLENIIPKLYRGVGNITNTGCFESEQVKLSCSVPNYFQLTQTLSTIDNIVTKIMLVLQQIDQLIKFNKTYEETINDKMKFHLRAQKWYAGFEAAFKKESTSNSSFGNLTLCGCACSKAFLCSSECGTPLWLNPNPP